MGPFGGDYIIRAEHLVNGIGALMKETLKSSLAPSPV